MLKDAIIIRTGRLRRDERFLALSGSARSSILKIAADSCPKIRIKMLEEK